MWFEYRTTPPGEEYNLSHHRKPEMFSRRTDHTPASGNPRASGSPRGRAIFLSYRRDDAEGEAGRLFDDLAAQFGESSVFMDVAGIEVGRDFRKAIDESVSGCGVLLAIIGKDWISATNEAGQRRLDDPSDFVRLETASALKRDIPVIPVLVRNAKMPRADQLPDDLKELAYRNGVELTHARWSSDLQFLIKALRPLLEQPATTVHAQKHPGWKTRVAILALVLCAVVAIAIGAYTFWSRQPKNPQPTASNSSTGNTKTPDVNPAPSQKSAPASQSAPAEKPAPSAVVAAPEKTSSTVSVPSVVGKSLPVARQDLQKSRLAIGNISRQERSHVARNTVLDEFPKPGKIVDVGTPIDLVLSETPSVQATASSPPQRPPDRAAPVADSSAQAPPARSLPNFAGTWELFEATRNGVPAPEYMNNAKPVTITQDGPMVHVQGNTLRITNEGTVAYRKYFASDDRSGHAVPSEDQADLIDSFTFRLQGSILVRETKFDYRRQYGNHQPGTDLRIMKYQRIATAPAASSSIALKPANLFSGSWVNANSATPGITRLEIQENGDAVTVHAWGACHPQDCDWGEQKGIVTDNSASVAWDQGFVLRKMTLTPENGRMKVVLESVYRDNRHPRHTEEYFTKR